MVPLAFCCTREINLSAILNCPRSQGNLNVTNDIVEMLKRMNLWQTKSQPLIQVLAVVTISILLSTLLTSLGQAQEFSQIDRTVFARGATVADTLEDGRRAQSGPDWDEGPQHNVQVSSFRIANRQVSMQEFANFMAGYRKRIESHRIEWSDDSPAVLVSWNEATAYCQWLSKQKQQIYRLPTEAEWELAAANADSLKLSEISDGVQEWCHDWWSPYKSTEKSLIDPRGPNSGTVRILRDGGGGSAEETKQSSENENVVGSPVVDYRVTDRSATVPDDRRRNLGFRLVIGKAFDGETAEQGGLAGVPFENVSPKKKDWIKNQATPYFVAGGKFIDPAKDQFAELPYWNRHHVPSITYCDNGDLLATAFTAPFDNSDQMAILITRLRNGTVKWDQPARFFVAPDHNVTSATLFNAGNGVIHHYNGLGNNQCEDFSMVKRISQDNGATWSAPKIVHRFPIGAATPENPFGKPRLWPHMDLKSYEIDGQRVLLLSTDVGAGNELGSAIFSSRDDGESWQEITRTGWNSDFFPDGGKQAGWIAGIHAPFEQLADGSLIAIGRSNNIDGFAPLSSSNDFGKTWAYTASPFPPTLSTQRTMLMRLSEGPLLFVGFTDSSVNAGNGTAKGLEFVDTSGKKETGLGMFAAISLDEGKSWTRRKLIPIWHTQHWKSRFYGYLSSVQTPDGMIHLVSSKYYYRFNLAWLDEAMPPKKKDGNE